MKLNKIFMALAAMAVVGCSSDDLNVLAPEQQAAEDSQLIQLDPNFAIAGVGVEDTGTRTHWEWEGTPGSSPLVNKFLPIYAVAPAGASLDNYFDLNKEAVGLCWLGQTPDENVYTNYQFYHFGWLNNGQTEAKFECDELMNGWTYDEIDVAAGDAVGDEADPADFAANVVKAIPFNPNYNSGVYKTDNKSIFGGDYIVYYPFNKDFKDAGTIPAIAETTFDPVSQAFDTPEIGKATFRYSSPVTIEGGDRAADFGLYNLSTLVQLRVACPVGDAAIGNNIDQIVLYSPSQKLIKQANLAADKIVAGKKGAELYAETEGTKTIVANFAAPVALAATTGVVTSAYITVLPTTVEDLVVLVHNSTNGTWATVALPNTVFEAGKAKRLDVTVANAAFTADYIAVDEASLMTAVAEAEAALALDATLTPTIEVIGDITLKAINSPYLINNWGNLDNRITITGDDIIIPEDASLQTIANIQSDIRVLGKSCCNGVNGGSLDIQGGTVSNVTMEPTEANVTTPAQYNAYNPTVTYNGAATVAAGKTFDVQAGNVIVNAEVKHKGAITIGEGAFVTVNGTGGLNFMGSTVVNDGTIEVEKYGKYDMTDAGGNATAVDGLRMTNNGKFIHNIDAAVGTAVQKMNQNGEYRCLVDEQIKLDDAFLQWTACSVIEMVNPGAYAYNLGTAAGITPVAYKHNGKFIDIEVNGGGLTTFENPIVVAPDGDNKEINVGNLTVLATSSGLDVDFIQGTGKRTLTVNGDFNVNQVTDLTDSKAIIVTNNLNVTSLLTYLPANGKLAVTKDINVKGGAFNAGAVDCINITCANFALSTGALATFGNRTDGAAKTMVVSGTITNPTGCNFTMVGANQNLAGSVLAWISCSQLIVGGAFPGGQPRAE